MQGTAQKFALAQPVSIRGNFGNLKHVLEQYFDPVERRETAFFEFQSRTHRSDESLQDHFQEMMDLATRAFSDMPDVTSSGQVINRFIQGLQTRECRKHVKFSKPKTLYDALKYAVSYEIFDTFDKDPKLPMVENHQRTPKALPIHVPAPLQDQEMNPGQRSLLILPTRRPVQYQVCAGIAVSLVIEQWNAQNHAERADMATSLAM